MKQIIRSDITTLYLFPPHHIHPYINVTLQAYRKLIDYLFFNMKLNGSIFVVIIIGQDIYVT